MTDPKEPQIQEAEAEQLEKAELLWDPIQVVSGLTDEEWAEIDEWSDDEDDPNDTNGFTELTADELVEMFTMMRGSFQRTTEQSIMRLERSRSTTSTRM